MENKGYLVRLDILRGVGAMLVVYQHFLDSFLPSFSTPRWPFGASLLAEGAIGVSLFCVVSGFIFEYLVRGQKIKYWTFMQARCWRIYPLYGLVLLAAAYLFGGDLGKVVEQLLLLVPVAKTGVLFGATWSIPVEFQFYLVFPFLTLLLARQGSKQMLMLIAFLIMLRAGLWAGGWDVNALGYWSIAGRADQFLLGMVSAKLFYEGRARVLANWPALVGSVLLMALGTQYFHNIYGAEFPWGQQPMTHWFSIVWPDVQAIGFALIVLSFLQLPVRIPKIIERPLLYIGTISFSIYIMHRVIELALVRIFNHGIVPFTTYPKVNALLMCATLEVPAVIVVASLAYYAIEKPFHQFKKPYIERAQEPEKRERHDLRAVTGS